MSDNAYDNIQFNGNFTEDGEGFVVTMDLNGVPIRFATVYVGDQREKFQEAQTAGQPQEDTEADSGTTKGAKAKA
jgi:hypothetical protein